MTISIDSQSFRDAAKKLEELQVQNSLSEEAFNSILSEEGFDSEDKDEFINTYQEYSKKTDKELEDPTEITGLNIVDPILRVGGRAIGEAARGTVEFAEDVAPNLTKSISDTFSSVSNKLGAYVPEEVKEYADEIFDPYHGDGVFAEGEKMAGNVLSYFIPATGIIKIGRGASSIAKGNKTVKAVLNKKPVKVLGYGSAYAGGATIVEDPSENLVNTLVKEFPESAGFLEAVAIDPDDSVAKQRLNAFLNNLGLEAAAFGGLGLLGLAYKKSKGLREIIVPSKLDNFLKFNLTTRRGLSDKHLAAFIKNDTAARNAYDLAAEDSKLLRKAMKQSNFSSPEQILKVDKALKGGTMQGLPQNVKDIVTNMRQNITDLSTFFTQNNRTSGNLKTSIDDRLNTYITRSFKIFENPEYVGHLEKVIKQNKKNITKGEINNITDDALKSMTDYFVNDLNMTPQQAFENLERTIKEFKDKGELLFHYAGKSKGSASSTKAFMKLKNIPNKVKAFYGEIKEPTINYVNSYQKLATYKAEIKFLEDLKTDMIRSGAAARGELKGKRWIAPEGIQDLELANDVLETRLGKIFGKSIVQKGSLKNPLDGLYIDPNYKKLLEEGIDAINPAENKSLQTWVKLKVGTQLAKTVFSPITHARNVLGNGVFMISNGFIPGAKGTIDAATFAASKFSGLKNKELVKKFNEYKELGITGTDIASETMKSNLSRLVSNPELYERSVFSPKSMGRKALDKVIEVYQLEDDIFKIMHFDNTMSYLRKAYPNIGVDKLKQMAAQRTRDLMPNYKIAPRFLKKMRSYVIGDFATFAAESARVSKNLIKYTIQDGLSGNGALSAMAARRLAGITAAGLGFDALSERSKILMGITDKDEDAIETVGEPWEFAVPQLFLSGIEEKNGEHSVKTVSTGAINPFTFPYTTAKVLHRIINDPKFTKENLSNLGYNPELQKMGIALFDKTLSPFIGTSMATDALLNAATGIKKSETAAEYGDVALKFLGSTLAPPVFKFLYNRNLYNEEKKTKEKGQREKGNSSKSLFSESTKGVPGEADWNSLFGFKVRNININKTIPFTIGFDLQRINKGKTLSNIFKNKLPLYKKGLKFFQSQEGLQKLGVPADTFGINEQDIKDAKITDTKTKLKNLKQIRMYLKAYEDLGLTYKDVVRSLKLNKNNPVGRKIDAELQAAYGNYFIPQMYTEEDLENYNKNLGNRGVRFPKEFLDEFNNAVENTKIDEDN